MSRRGWSTSNFLRYASGVVTAVPVTMACWAKTSITGSVQGIMGLHASGSTHARNNFRLRVESANQVSFSSANGANSDGAGASTTITANTWFHVCGVSSSSTSRAVYFNGGSKGTNATNLTPSGINRTSIGVGDGSTPTFEFAPGGTGDIAEAAIWNIALSDADVAALAAGASPLLIHPEALVGYWPLLGNNSPENNLLSNTSVLSVQGSLSAAAHPPVFIRG